MAVNITGVATSFVSPRSLQATSTGRLWVAAGDATANTIEFWYSDDAGVTWTENTAAQITWDGANYFAFYIDADDHAHIAYDETATVALKYRRNKSISTTSAWSAASTVDSTTATAYQWADLVAHREGTGWKAHILYKRNTTGTDLMLYAPITITSADVITVETKVTVDSDVGASNAAGGIDFHHTASDEKAIQSSTPHLYMVWCDGAWSVNFAKYTYSGGSWTAGTTRVIWTAGAALYAVSMVFDGTRVIIAATVNSATMALFERDAADTTTTSQASTSSLLAQCVTYDQESNVWIVGDNNSGDLYARKFVRSTLTWASAELVDTDNPGICAMRRTGGNTIAIAYADTSGAGARFDQTYNNVAPSAPTWVNTDNVGADVGAALVLDWAPAHLLAFSVALVSDFDATLRAWRDYHANQGRGYFTLDLGFLAVIARARVEQHVAARHPGFHLDDFFRLDIQFARHRLVAHAILLVIRRRRRRPVVSRPSKTTFPAHGWRPRRTLKE